MLPICSRARSTGTLVSLDRAVLAGLDDVDGPWVTVCETHGAILNHATRSNAERSMPYPAEWCEDCRALVAEREEVSV